MVKGRIWKNLENIKRIRDDEVGKYKKHVTKTKWKEKWRKCNVFTSEKNEEKRKSVVGWRKRSRRIRKEDKSEKMKKENIRNWEEIRGEEIGLKENWIEDWQIMKKRKK